MEHFCRKGKDFLKAAPRPLDNPGPAMMNAPLNTRMRIACRKNTKSRNP